MKQINLLQVLALLLLASASTSQAQTTAFSYQGRLNVSGSPANGLYDFTFRLFDAASGGSSVSSTVNVNGLGVTNGLFTATIDFSSAPFAGQQRWLQIFVRTNNTIPYQLLSPRQALTPTPYAIYSIASGNAVQLGGQAATAFVAKAGDTMTGTLNLPANGLNVGGNQLVASSGKVGIGTTGPQAPLHVVNANGNYGYLGDATRGVFGYSAAAGGVGVSGLHGTTGNYGQLGKSYAGVYGVAADSASYGVSAEAVDGWALVATAGTGPIPNLLPTAYLAGGNGVGPWAAQFIGRVAISGNVGIGTTTPGAPLHIERSQAYERLVSTSTFNGSLIEMWNYTPQQIDGPPVTLGAINFGDGSTTPGQISYQVNQGMGFRVGGAEQMRIDAGGNVSVGTLTIRGGADLAEPFELSSKNIPKGSLVVIDEANPGYLKLSDRECDKRVAGIVSGANGIKPGLSLHQEGALEGGENVALSGRVFALADAAYGTIKPGDLLTTSNTPGHCMKVTNQGKAQGAIIGKAMSSLKDGKGMVLVLVTLQ